MNETLKVIKSRFSCRDFTDQLPTDEQLNAIAQAAIQSPSGMNRQNWQVIVIKNKELLAEMEAEGLNVLKNMNPDLHQQILSQYGSIFYHAPCMIMIAFQKSGTAGDAYIDLGIITQNTTIAATSLDLETLICGFATLPFMGNKATYFKEKLQIADGYECGLAVLLGHAHTVGTPHQPDQSKITYIK